MTGAIKQRRQGTEEAKAAAEKDRPRYDRPEFLTSSLKDEGSSIYVQLIDNGNEWWFANQHNFMDTRGPADDWSEKDKERYPEKKGAVCRNDELFIDPDTGERSYEDCYLCSFAKDEKGRPERPSQRKWARAVVKKPVTGTQKMVDDGEIKAHRVGKIVDYEDEIIEVELLNPETGKPTGERVKKPRIVIINHGDKNFFRYFTAFYKGNDRNICDRVYRITVEGKGMQKDHIVQDVMHLPEFDLDDPELKAKYLAVAPDLGALIEEQSSDWYYETYFDVRKPHPPRKFVSDDEEDDNKPARRKKLGGSAPTEQQGKPATSNVDTSALDEMASRIERNSAPVA